MTAFTVTTWRRALTSLSMLTTFLILSGCGGGGGGNTGGGTAPPPPPVVTPPPPAVSDIFSSAEKTSRFLGKATFGGPFDEIDSLTGTEVSDWIKAEFDKTPSLYLQAINDEMATLPAGQRVATRRIGDLFFNAAISGEDQLRQRMVLALSEIIVVSNAGQLQNFPESMGHYMDILSNGAFGNYRDLLEEITYSPAMAHYLTYRGNRKGDPATGRVPDENYARELLQLFTIGLTELNPDGTEKLDSQGEPIELFDNTDITGLAKVFTGMSWSSGRFNNRVNRTSLHTPLLFYPQEHSTLEKSFLGTTIPSFTSGEQSLDLALDAIFEHPNVGPFLSRQLIQRFTMSNPAPDYVERVAASFDSGTYTLPDGSSVGTGSRGDLKATIAAILLDEDALQDPTATAAQSGKIREPIIRFVNWARAFNVTSPVAQDERTLNNLSGLGQHPFRSPSVFNFFRPGFVAPGTETAQAGITAPELQIINESTVMAYINFMNAFIYDRSANISNDPSQGIVPDYSNETAVADDKAALIERLDILLTGGALSDDSKTRISSMMDEIPVRAGTSDETADRLARVRVATSMIMNSPDYLVQR